MTWTVESLTDINDGLVEVGLYVDHLGFRHRIKVLVPQGQPLALRSQVNLTLEPENDHG